MPPDFRHALLDRFGLYRLRLATMHIHQGCTDATAFAAELVRDSGLQELQTVLRAHFTQRAARGGTVATDQCPGCRRERGARAGCRGRTVLSSGAHEFVELRLLPQLRCGELVLPEAGAVSAQRLLGDEGIAAAARLALPRDAPADAVRAEALAQLVRWRQRAEDPFAGQSQVRVYRAVARSCDGVVAATSSAAR